jgi:TPR repeat protein
LKRAKFHYEAAAMAGHGPARSNLGLMELKSGNMKRAVKHWIIAASAGNYGAMYGMITLFTHKVLLVKNQLIQLWQHTIVLVPK